MYRGMFPKGNKSRRIHALTGDSRYWRIPEKWPAGLAESGILPENDSPRWDGVVYLIGVSLDGLRLARLDHVHKNQELS